MQADWKPELPDKFGEIDQLVKSVESLNVEPKKTQGSILKLLSNLPAYVSI